MAAAFLLAFLSAMAVAYALVAMATINVWRAVPQGKSHHEDRPERVVAEREGLKGRPAPDTFLAGARALGVVPGRAAVFGDALAGLAAGRAGGSARVAGVGRVGRAGALREHGASAVISDLSEPLEEDR